MNDAIIEFPSGQVRQRTALAADQQLAGAFATLRTAWQHDGGLSVGRRAGALHDLAKTLLKYESALVDAVSADFGHRSPHETRMADIHASLSAIRHNARHFRRWMRSRSVPVAASFLPGRAAIDWVPCGVVGIISPWNYPIHLALVPLAAAIAAGNRVLLKPSEITPRTSALLARLLAEVFDPGEVGVICGGSEMAQALCHLPLDHLLFTGSTGIGRQVMRTAADNLVPVTLELGGKSPCIVAPDFPLELAARRIAAGKLLNAGQTCVAPDYVLVPRGRELGFIDHFERATAALYPSLERNPDYSAIVNDQHYNRLVGLIDEARRRGAHARLINPASEALPAHRRKLAPTLLWHVPEGAAVMVREIFGPILPVLTYDRLQDAVALVNERPAPLALYLFTYDGDHRRLVLDHTRSGGVTINDTLLHAAQDALPFGGVGESGVGAYHGEAGFRSFSHARARFTQSRFNLMGLIRPPYGPRLDRILRWLLR